MNILHSDRWVPTRWVAALGGSSCATLLLQLVLESSPGWSAIMGFAFTAQVVLLALSFALDGVIRYQRHAVKRRRADVVNAVLGELVPLVQTVHAELHPSLENDIRLQRWTTAMDEIRKSVVALGAFSVQVNVDQGVTSMESAPAMQPTPTSMEGAVASPTPAPPGMVRTGGAPYRAVPQAGESARPLFVMQVIDLSLAEPDNSASASRPAPGAR